jgi:methenyltetrahydrofolate cyclohydrolase
VTAGDPSLEIEGVLETLGSPGHVAAAGSAAGLAGALAAAVIAKAARASNRPATAAQAIRLQQRLTLLATRDAEALGEARRLLAAPGDGRDAELGRALHQAMTVPGEIGASCADVAVLAGAEREAVLPDHRPDLEAAAALAAGASRAAAHLVAINLAATPDDAEVTASRAAAEAATEVVAGFGRD